MVVGIQPEEDPARWLLHGQSKRAWSVGVETQKDRVGKGQNTRIDAGTPPSPGRQDEVEEDAHLVQHEQVEHDVDGAIDTARPEVKELQAEGLQVPIVRAEGEVDTVHGDEQRRKDPILHSFELLAALGVKGN